MFACPVARVPGRGVVSFPSGSGINFQAPGQASVVREGAARGRRETRLGAAEPRTAGLMDLAAPGSGSNSLPLLLAFALVDHDFDRLLHFEQNFKFSFVLVIFELAGLAILHGVVADGNSTRSPESDGLFCGDPGENCTATTTQSKRRGHFSKCPKQYKHYCLKGRCRFVVAEQTPSCVCDEGYAGARCERVDLFYLREDRGKVLVICLVVVMVIFIILVVGVCICCQ
ncbi:Probetacellulin [Galemys pyrenaicus]|uniref:Probetacellulin n=1 Tax=Galemys pyrenaicus TaxID=202257 RepID=A0A8J6DNX1_GALPY|nr:Probetacellulin [Galemys pyrenaicus]